MKHEEWGDGGRQGRMAMKVLNGEKDCVVYSRDIVKGINDSWGGERVKGEMKDEDGV